LVPEGGLAGELSHAPEIRPAGWPVVAIGGGVLGQKRRTDIAADAIIGHQLWIKAHYINDVVIKFF